MTLQKIFSDSFNDFYRNPLLILAPLGLSLIIYFLSYISTRVNYKIGSSGPTILTLWLIVYTIILVMFISFFLAGLIGLSLNIIKGRKNNIKEFFSYSKKFFLKNFIIIVIFIIADRLVFFVPFYIALSLGNFFHLALRPAQIIFFTIYIIGLLGFLMFLSLSSFYLVIENNSIINSIKSSIRTVKNNYLPILIIFLISFVLLEIIQYFSTIISSWLAEIIGAIIITPLLSLALTRIVLKKFT